MHGLIVIELWYQGEGLILADAVRLKLDKDVFAVARLEPHIGIDHRTVDRLDDGKFWEHLPGLAQCADLFCLTFFYVFGQFGTI